MSYGYSKGPLIMGDISGSDDSDRNTGIDFEEDYIALKTNGNTRFRISGSSGEIRFNESFTFPISDGNANQVLKTNGSGQLSWTDQSGGGGGGGSTNSFQTISVSGQSDVVADSSTDTLTLVGGDNINITTNAGSDELTIAAHDVGKVLQVVHVSFTGSMSATSTSWTNVTDGTAIMQASITPSADSSKIVVQVSANIAVKQNYAAVFQLWDGSAAVGGGVHPSGYNGTDTYNASAQPRDVGVLFSIFNTTNTYHNKGYAAMVEDSPSTTNQVTYTFRGRSAHSSATFYVNRNTRNQHRLEDSLLGSSITLYEIGA
jgi:hypothetical protein